LQKIWTSTGLERFIGDEGKGCRSVDSLNPEQILGTAEGHPHGTIRTRAGMGYAAEYHVQDASAK
jgi:hypothetical protein